MSPRSVTGDVFRLSLRLCRQELQCGTKEEIIVAGTNSWKIGVTSAPYKPSRSKQSVFSFVDLPL